MGSECAVRMENITKRFGKVTANNAVFIPEFGGLELAAGLIAEPEGAAGTPPFWRGRKIDKVFVLVLLVLFIQDMIP